MPPSDDHLTPKRRRVIPQEQPAAPASPAARALSGLRSWLSPWRGSATRSAAFGSNEAHQDDHDHTNDSSPAADQSLYPALPSSTSNQMITDDQPQPSQQIATPSGSGPSSFPFTFTPPAAEQQHSPTVNNPFSQRTPNAPSITSPVQPILPSPRSHNFDILSRFFAEKAAAENGGQLDPESSTLTPEEIRGCIDLIQQSGAHPAELQQAVLDQADSSRASSSYEAPARRRNTVRRSWLSPAPSHTSRHDYNDTHSDISRSAHTHTDMSFSPERDFPIPHTARSPPPPSRSYLAPLGRSTMTYSSTEPASIFARSLTGRPSNGASVHGSSAAPNPFLTGSTSVAGSLAGSASSSAAATSRRRRRPLYLGPGLSSSSAAALRRRQAIPQSTRPTQQTQTSAVGLGKRQRVQSQEEPSGHHFAMALDAPPSPASNTMSHSSYSRNIASLPQMTPTGKASNTSLPAQSEPAKAPPAPSPVTQRQTRAANAARSILAEVDLPKPSPSRKSQVSKSAEQQSSSAKSSLSTLSEDSNAFSDTSFRPDTILNPYQSSPGLNFAKSANGSTASSRKSRSSEAFEKMKNERRKSTRMRRNRSREDDDDQHKEDDEEPGDTSLLEQIERHRPSSMRHGKTASSRASSMASKSPEPPSTPHAKSLIPSSTTPTSAPPQASVAAKESDKTQEARRRLEAMKKNSKPPPAAPSSPSTASSSSSSNQAPATPATASSKPFSFASSPFTHAHAPGKPSRLSIAFNANESPSSTASSAGEDDEEEERSAKAASPPKETVFTSGSKSQFSFAPAPAPELKSTSQPFSFGKPTNDTTASDQPTPPVKSFDFGGSQAAKSAGSAPFSFQPTATTSNGTKPATSTPSLSFNPAPVPSLKKGKDESAPSAQDVQAEALKKSAGALPVFDLGTNAVAKVSEDGVHVVEAIKFGADELPRYEVVKGQAGSATVSAPTAANPPFSFNAQSKPFTPSAPPSTDTSAAAPAPSAAPAAEEAAEENTGGSNSSLFEGGQGEEGEETAFEVRAKIRKFVGGKWEDLGIGIARVKTRTDDDGTAIRRLLVRNSGNGAVTVNFRLFKDFKATQKSKQVSFTGFDAEGKGSPMSCQVKTEDSAKEFKDALEAAS